MKKYTFDSPNHPKQDPELVSFIHLIETMKDEELLLEMFKYLTAWQVALIQEWIWRCK